MKFKNDAPALLASGIVGFVSGIGVFSFYVNKPFEDMGSLPDWIGALATIVAGVWAYKRFAMSRQERFEVTPPTVSVMTRKGEGEENGIIVDSFLIKVVNRKERPTSIVYVGIAVYLDDSLDEFLYSTSFNLNMDKRRLEFDDYIVASHTFKSIFFMWETMKHPDSPVVEQSKQEKMKEATSFVAVPYVEFAVESKVRLFKDQKVTFELSELKDDMDNAAKVKKNLRAYIAH